MDLIREDDKLLPVHDTDLLCIQNPGENYFFLLNSMLFFPFRICIDTAFPSASILK